MVRGYLRMTTIAVDIQKDVALLNAEGVSTENIIIHDDFSVVLRALNRGDYVVVCRLSDICTSISDLFYTVEGIVANGATIYSIKEPWLDVESCDENLVELVSNLNQLNREIVSIRTKRGLVKVRAEGKKLGRPIGAKKNAKSKVDTALQLYTQSDTSVKDICEMLNLTPRTLYRYISQSSNVALRRGETEAWSKIKYKSCCQND